MKWKLRPLLMRNVNVGYWIERFLVCWYSHFAKPSAEFHERQARKWTKKIKVPFSFMEIFKKEYGWEIADPLCQVYNPQVGTVWQQANYGAVTRMIFISCLPWNQSGAAHQSLIFFSLISSPGLAFCSILIFL